MQFCERSLSHYIDKEYSSRWHFVNTDNHTGCYASQKPADSYMHYLSDVEKGMVKE